MSLPRLLFCCFDVVPAPTALSRRLCEYLKHLSEKFQVDVLSVKTLEHAHIARLYGARLLRVPVGTGDLASRMQSFDRAVRRQLQSEEYNVVHFFDPVAGVPLCDGRETVNYRLVFDASSFPSVDWPLIRGLTSAGDLAPRARRTAEAADTRLMAKLKRQELFCLMNAHVVIVGNPLTRDYVLGLGVQQSRIQVLRAPVDVEAFEPQFLSAPDETPMRVTHLGALALGRGLETLIEAIALTQKRQPGLIRLNLLGPVSPEMKKKLEAQISHHCLQHVEICKAIAHGEIPSALATCDLGIIGLDENVRNITVGSPLARLPEFLAAGRGCLVADLPSAQTVAPEEGVVWYRPDDPLDLATKLIELAIDPERRKVLGAAAARAAHLWDGARCRNQLHALYAEILPIIPAEAEGLRAHDLLPELTEHHEVEPRSQEAVTQLGTRAMDDSAPRMRLVTEELFDKKGLSSSAETHPAAALPTAALDSFGSRSNNEEDDIKEVHDFKSEDTPEEIDAAPHQTIDLMADSAALSIHEDSLDFPRSAINPWLAQLLFGYCPPERQIFERHTPPPLEVKS
jgi:glycosyltransferase involved in cell wall biosynthesis